MELLLPIPFQRGPKPRLLRFGCGTPGKALTDQVKYPGGQSFHHAVVALGFLRGPAFDSAIASPNAACWQVPERIDNCDLASGEINNKTCRELQPARQIIHSCKFRSSQQSS
jgi:hypothetical protein